MTYEVGQECSTAAAIAVEEINASGGIKVGDKKYKIDFSKTDTNEMRSITDAVSTIERLVTAKKVDFIVGAYRTEAVLAMQEIMADYKKIWISAYSGSAEPCVRLTKDFDRYKYYFKLATINSQYLGKIMFNEVSMVAAKVREKLGVEKPRVAIVAEKVLWVEPIVKAAQTVLPKMGIEIVGTWMPSPTATDVTSELTAIKNADAHIIFFVCCGPIGVPFPRQWGELKIPAALIGINCMSMTDRNWEETGGLCNYEATLSCFADADITPYTRSFIKKFKKRYGYTPGYGGSDYDAVMVLKDAIERAGTLDTDAVIAALEKTDYIGVSGRIAFTPKDHPKWPHCIKFGPGYSTTCVGQWIDGKQYLIWPDGKALLGDKSWVGLKYEGTVEYQLPPWMVKYWQSKK